MDPLVRPIGGREELEQCFDLWGSVFGEGRRFFQSRLDLDRTYSPATTWVAVADGEIVSAAQLFPFEAQWGGVALRVAGIGSVATRPTHRGRGLALAILNAQRRWMEEAGSARKGFALALLFAAPRAEPLYARAGFHRLPFGTAVAWEPVGWGHPPYRVRPVAEGDWPALRAIYASQLSHLPMGHIRPPAFWADAIRWTDAGEPGGVRLVAESGGEVAGYLFYRWGEDGRARVLEVVAHPGHPRAAEALAQEVYRRAGAGRALPLTLPVGHGLARGRPAEPGPDRAMWSVVNPAALVRAIHPVLQRRWVEERGPLEVAAVPGGMHLRWPSGERTLAGQNLLAAMMTGLEGDPLLQGLFPFAPPYLWSLDHF